MYVPELYIPNREAQFDLIDQCRFGVLTTSVGGALKAVHIPFVLDRARGPHGTLRAHLSRENDISTSLGEAEVLIVFQGPHSYVSPDWYATPMHFPTWVYTAVHAYGVPRVLTEEELCRQLEDLIASEERKLAPKEAWTLDRAPPDLVDKLRRMIVGFEVPVDRMEGCFKLNQHKSPEDLRRMNEVFRGSSDERRALADHVERHMPRGDAPRPKLRFEDKITGSTK